MIRAAAIWALLASSAWAADPNELLEGVPDVPAPVRPGRVLPPVGFAPTSTAVFNERGQSILVDPAGSLYAVHAGRPRVVAADRVSRTIVVDEGAVKFGKFRFNAPLIQVDLFGRRIPITPPSFNRRH